MRSGDPRGAGTADRAERALSRKALVRASAGSQPWLTRATAKLGDAAAAVRTIALPIPLPRAGLPSRRHLDRPAARRRAIASPRMQSRAARRRGRAPWRPAVPRPGPAAHVAFTHRHRLDDDPPGSGSRIQAIAVANADRGRQIAAARRPSRDPDCLHPPASKTGGFNLPVAASRTGQPRRPTGTPTAPAPAVAEAGRAPA